MAGKIISVQQSLANFEPFGTSIRLEELSISDFPARFYKFASSNVCKVYVESDTIRAFYHANPKTANDFKFMQASPEGIFLVDCIRQVSLVNITKKKILDFNSFSIAPVKSMDNTNVFVLMKSFKTGTIYNSNGMDVILAAIYNASIDLQSVDKIDNVSVDNVYLYILMLRNLMGKKSTRMFLQWQVKHAIRLLYEAANFSPEKNIPESLLTSFNYEIDRAIESFVNLSEIAEIFARKDLPKKIKITDDIGLGLIEELYLKNGRTLQLKLKRSEHETVKGNLKTFLESTGLANQLNINYLIEE